MPQDRYLEAIRTNNRAGLEEIYQEFLPGIIRLITTKGGNRDDAMDVFQSALIILFERVREKEFELQGAFGGFLHSICRNIWGNRLQKKSFQEVRTADFIKYDRGEGDWEALMVQEEKRVLLVDHLNRIGEECRKLLRMFFDRKSMKEIQEAMGWKSVSYASKRKFQCKEKLISSIQGDPRFRELKT